MLLGLGVSSISDAGTAARKAFDLHLLRSEKAI